jgi:hypothetical protein
MGWYDTYEILFESDIKGWDDRKVQKAFDREKSLCHVIFHYFRTGYVPCRHDPDNVLKVVCIVDVYSAPIENVMSVLWSMYNVPMKQRPYTADDTRWKPYERSFSVVQVSALSSYRMYVAYEIRFESNIEDEWDEDAVESALADATIRDARFIYLKGYHRFGVCIVDICATVGDSLLTDGSPVKDVMSVFWTLYEVPMKHRLYKADDSRWNPYEQERNSIPGE